MTDQGVLADAAKNDQGSDVRRAAVVKLTDQRILADIAKNDETWQARKAAVEKLTDQSILADVAKNDQDSDVRKAALWKLTDQRILADIAKNARWSDVGVAAAENLADQGVLADVAKNAIDSDARKAAVNKLTDQEILADVAKNAMGSDARKAAKEKMKIPGKNEHSDSPLPGILGTDLGVAMAMAMMEFTHQQELMQGEPDAATRNEHGRQALQSYTSGSFPRWTSGGICDVCRQRLTGKTAYAVPNHVFYHSRQYINWCVKRGISETYLRMREAQDTSPGSAICEDCIHMFP